MRNQRLIIVIILSLFLSTSIAQDKFKSYKDVKKIPNGMNIIHENGFKFTMNGFSHLIF